MTFPSPPPLDSRPKKLSHQSTLRQQFLRHIFRRFVLVLPICALMIILAQNDIIETLIDHYTFNKPQSWFDNPTLIRHLRLLITHNGMTSNKPKCLLFIIHGDDPITATRIDVLEKQSPPCSHNARDPHPSLLSPLPHHLFTLRINRLQQSIETDQNSIGNFHPIFYHSSS